SASGRWSIDNPDLTRLQLAMKKFEQIGAANGVEQHRPVFNRPPLSIHAIAIAADRKANHARTKCLKQHLGVGWVVAEIRDNRSLVIMPAHNRGEAPATAPPLTPRGGLAGLLHPHAPGVRRPQPPDNRGRMIATASYIMRDDERAKTGPSGGVISIEYHGSPLSWNGFAMGTARSWTAGPTAGTGGTKGPC